MIKNSGWARPLNARKHHYFKEGDVISICGKWMYSGWREEDDFESPDDCVECRKKINDQKECTE